MEVAEQIVVLMGEGEKTWVQTTKAQAEELELAEGEIVWLRPVAPAADPHSDEPIPA